MLSYNNWIKTDLSFHVLKSLAFWCLKLQCRWKVAIRKIETKTVGFLWRESRVWADYRPWIRTCSPKIKLPQPHAYDFLLNRKYDLLLSWKQNILLRCLAWFTFACLTVWYPCCWTTEEYSCCGTRHPAGVPHCVPNRALSHSQSGGWENRQLLGCCRWAVWKGVVCIQLACHLLSPGADVWLDEKVEGCKQRSNLSHSDGSHQFRVGASVSCNHNFFF